MHRADFTLPMRYPPASWEGQGDQNYTIRAEFTSGVQNPHKTHFPPATGYTNSVTVS